MATSDANGTRRDLRRLRYRKNIRRLSEAELLDLRRAFEGLYRISATTDDAGTVNPAGNAADERGYQWIAGVHGAPAPLYCKHGSIDFPTWHRAYLYYFEKLLQDQVPDVTLPWWDWASPEAQAEGLPEAVTAETYLDPGTGEQRPNPLASAFSQWTGQMTSRSPSPPAELAPLAAAVEFAMVQTEYVEFVADLENPHGGLHVWVGGDMGSVPTAAYDPVFWFHHANVDRQWYMWQQEHPNAAMPPEVLSFVCAPFNLTGADVVDAAALGYAYVDRESMVSATDVRAAAAAMGATPAAEDAPEPEPSVTFELDRPDAPFRRASLEFVGVHPPEGSYVVHIFLGNVDATLDTARTTEEGYAGILALFGHGHCIGGPGHCDVPDRSADPFDRRMEHHLAPFDTRVDVTFPLMAVLGRDGDGDGPLPVTLVVADPDGAPADASVVEVDALSLVTRA